MSTTNSRKRAAPGASPIVPYQQRVSQPYVADNAMAEPMTRWNGSGNGSNLVAGSTDRDMNKYTFNPTQQQYTPTAPTPSNSLTRRSTNHALVQTNPRSAYPSSAEAWPGLGDDNSALMPQNDFSEGLVAQDSVEVLEELAQKAKRETQNKRKQIPPFVQKLSSFLEERKNEDLIRWSENGDSFIVLDEDEFAKTLIPELFKHNNYASFVRQLNMYGFHKRVGLSDNSMRASERKNKSPSEYYNPFFRRGHPNLLWLINKPKSGSKAKKSGKHTEGEGDSEEDNGQEEGSGQGLAAPNASSGRSMQTNESQPLQKKEMTLIREELNKVRDQQKMILGAINQLQRNNNDLYSQALMFQNQHDRHQNSINAILNFLANVFRKTLEDGSHQNVGDIISSMMSSSQASQPSHQQGSVFDLGDFVQTQVESTHPIGGTHKRTRGLLPPISDRNDMAKPNRSPSTGSQPYYPMSSHNPRMGHVTELLDGSNASPRLRQELEANPQERMMKIINDHNATNTSGMDLPDAAELISNTPGTLNVDQRDKLVDLMSKQSSPALPKSTVAMSLKSPASAIQSPSPPPTADHMTVPPLSPIMRSPTMNPPSLQQINSNQVDLDQLQRLQSEQDAKISELSELLGPLSPSGRIPSLGHGTEGFLDPPAVDLDQYFDSNAFLNEIDFAADGNDFNFNLDSVADVDDPLSISHRPVAPEAVKCEPSTITKMENGDIGAGDSLDRDGKRRRTG